MVLCEDLISEIEKIDQEIDDKIRILEEEEDNRKRDVLIIGLREREDFKKKYHDLFIQQQCVSRILMSLYKKMTNNYESVSI